MAADPDPTSSGPGRTPRVTDSYDRIADIWRADRGVVAPENLRELPWIEALIAPLSPGASILDVGCGCGTPIGAELARRGFALTGLDGSARMLDHAGRTVPSARFIHGDMRTADPGGPFDAAIAWDSVFHLPRADHPAMFARLAGWLRPGGRILISLGGSGGEDFSSEMYGETFSYGGYAPAEAIAMLRAAGFRIERWEVDDPHSRGHIAVLAVRSAG